MRRLQAVLLDVDGTLVDTLDAWKVAFDRAVATVPGIRMRGEDAARWIGAPIETVLEERCGLAGQELERTAEAFRRALDDSVLEGVRPFPGVTEMLPSLRMWRLAAITNKRHDTTLKSLRAAGLLEPFNVVLGGDSVPRKKPAPDPILHAARELGVPVQACAMVGDTEYDVQAGKSAGAVTVGVTWGYGARAFLEEAGVDFLVETPAALPPLLRALTPSTGT